MIPYIALLFGDKKLDDGDIPKFPKDFLFFTG